MKGKEKMENLQSVIPETMKTQILLQLYQSATLANQISEIWDDIHRAFELAGVKIETTEDEWKNYKYGKALTRLGVPTIWGTPLGDEKKME